MSSAVEILALALSPRKSGNSDLMLDAFIQGAEETGARVTRLAARSLKVKGCLECGECDEAGVCIIRDDMDDLYPLLIETRRIVLASPIFFYGVPSGGKAIVDRTQALWNRVRLYPRLRRPEGRGFFLGVGATKGRDLFEGTLLMFKYFLEAIGLPKKNVESLTYRKIEAKAAVMEHPTALREAYMAGKAFAKL